MLMRPCTVAATALALLIAGAAPAAPAQQTPEPLEMVRQGRRLSERGEHEEALARYRQALEIDPELFEAHLNAGRALDLLGQHAEARRHFEKAIEFATEAARGQALAAMGISYAFERRTADAARFYQKLFDERMETLEFGSAAAIANALGRIYLEAGDLENAEHWYRTGYETSKQIPEMSAAEADLWAFRWEHARARIAARGGDLAEARRRAAEVKAIVDRGLLDEAQRPFYPYLLGYIALYAGDHQTALDELLRSDLEDPFVLGLIASTYRHMENAAKAREYYEKVMASPSHSINSAFARPEARIHLRQ